MYAALLRTQRLGLSPASASALFGKIARLRDVTGGYGSSLATLEVVRALLTSQLDAQGTSHVRLRARGVDRVIDVPDSGFVTVPLPAGTLDVDVAVDGQGVVARLERPVLRSFRWTSRSLCRLASRSRRRRRASQVQGVLALRQQVSPDGLTTEIPLRFGLSGKVTVPEATARIARSASGVATAPARVLSVR